MEIKPKLIGKLQPQAIADLKEWLEARRHLLKPSLSRYAPGRAELWLKVACDLRSPPTLSPGYRDERIEALGERLLPGWDIGLILKYPPKVAIGLHRDHRVFAAREAVAVNLEETNFLMAARPQAGENPRPTAFCLQTGDCISFNPKKLHGTTPIETERWSIIFWYLRPEYKTP